MKKKKYELLWLGETPIIPSTKRVFDIVETFGHVNFNFADYQDGMQGYDYYKGMIKDFDIIATDQEEIDPSWEYFFSKENRHKWLYQWKDEKWIDLKPGFSINKEHSGKIIKLF